MSWLPYLIVLPVLVSIQLLIRRVLGKTERIGDENGYVQCGGQIDPYCPSHFLRVPLMAWLSKQAHRFCTNPEQALRSATSTASMVTILASMICAQILGGLQAALVIGLLLTLMPGRIILSRHIWPDIWLGLWLALACLILVYPDLTPNLRSVLLGSIAAMAFLTRFDALLLAPFICVGMAPLPLWHWLLILAPTLIAFGLLSIRNRRRYRIPWPDNTWMFNIMVAAGEAQSEQSAPVLVENGVLKVAAAWNQLSDRERLAHSHAGLRQLFLRPVRAAWGLVTRFWASLGPDSFVLHRLLPPGGAAYPEIPAPLNRLLGITLTLVFPIFASATLLAVMIAGAPAPAFLWPTLALASGSLIHNRTRYRQAWLPGAALLLISALAEPEFWPTLFSSESLPAWAVSVVLAAALIRFPVRPDAREAP